MIEATKINLEDRLLLRHVISFEFMSSDSTEGFAVRATRDLPNVEGFAFLRYYEHPWLDPLTKDVILAIWPAVLAGRELRPESLFWVPWHPLHPLPDEWSIVTRDDERDACRLAVEIADGDVQPKDVTAEWRERYPDWLAGPEQNTA